MAGDAVLAVDGNRMVEEGLATLASAVGSHPLAARECPSA